MKKLSYLILFSFLSGCATFQPLGARTYDVVFANYTSDALSEVGYASSLKRHINAHSYAMEGIIPRPIPDRVNFTWRTPDGTLHTQDVEVASKMPHPQAFRGDIFFNIRKDGVTAVPVHEKDKWILPQPGDPDN